MANGNLVNGATLNGTFTLEKKSGTLLTLQTADKYVDKLIELTLNAQTATPQFSGGDVLGSTDASFVNLEVGTTNTSGVVIQATGSAQRAPLEYKTAVDGWVEKASGEIAYPPSRDVSFESKTYYAKGVTLENGTSFYVTVPNGTSGTVTFHFAVDADGNVTIT